MHRAFLQAFMTRGVMTEDEIKPVLAAVMTAHSMLHAHIFPPLRTIPDFPLFLLSSTNRNPPDPDRPWSPGDVTTPLIQSTLQTVNAKLMHYDYEIRSGKDQQTRTTVHALVNLTSDALTQLATKFSASEIGFIRRVLDCMFDTNNTRNREIMALTHTQTSQLARPPRRNRQSQINGDGEEETQQQADTAIQLSDADNVLDSLVNEGFFQKSRKNYYSLAPRALIELRGYLKETYNDTEEDPPIIRIHDCEVCKEIVTWGMRCDNRDCGVRWHDACERGLFGGRSRAECPSCKTVCSKKVYVGERVETVGRSGTGGRGSMPSRRAEVEDLDAEGDSDD